MKSILLVLILFSSCASSQIKENDIQIILQLAGNQIIESVDKYSKQDTAHVIPEPNNDYLIRLLTENFKEKMNNDVQYDLIFKTGELDYLVNQLKINVDIEADKFRSPRIIKFKKSTSGKHPDVTDYRKLKFHVSNPAISKNNKWGFVLITREDLGSAISIYKKDNNKWVFYRFVSIGMV